MEYISLIKLNFILKTVQIYTYTQLTKKKYKHDAYKQLNFIFM